MLPRTLARVGLCVFVAFAAAVAASEEGSQIVSSECHGPSLLQVDTVRKKVAPVDHEDIEVGNGTNVTATVAPTTKWAWGNQFYLEVGTLVALLVLLCAGIYLWLEYKMGWRSERGLNRLRTMRLVAWGENVQNEVCDYVMVFSTAGKTARTSRHRLGGRPSADPTRSSASNIFDRNQRMVAGFEMAKKVFLESHRHHFVTKNELRERFQNEMTFEDYRDEACELLHTMLSSAQFGFTIQQFFGGSAEKERMFWRLDLAKVAVEQYAAHYRYPVSLNDEAYELAGCTVPRNWDGEQVHAHWAYIPKWARMYKPLSQTDRLKLIRMRLERYINIAGLLEQKVLLQHFAVHDLDEIGDLLLTWASLSRWYRFPTFWRIDRVKNYFGEHVAFMFMWQRYYMSGLLVPAIVGGAVFFRRFCLPERTHTTVQMVFTVVMSLWATIFNARYKRHEARTRQRWGMGQVASGDQEDMQVGYEPEQTGSWWITFVYMFGDFSALVMMLFTILGTFMIQRLRSHYLDVFGIDSRWYVDKGIALLTSMMILLMDWVWQFGSYVFVNRENHRLRSTWWESWIKRVITVRFFTNLYPFFYVGFLKEYSPDGCPTSGSGCLDELQLNLLVFFGLSLFCNVARDIGLILYARIMHVMELRGHNDESEHMSIKVQATLYDYNDWVFIDDWTRQVTTFLLLTCFNVVLPVIGVFVLLTTMFEARLLAHRICCNLQRPFPQGAQGIGTWQSVLEVMTLAGVLMTVSFAIFVMKPLRDKPLWDKFIIFVVAEHALLLLNLFVRAKFEATPPDVHEATEQNEKLLMQNLIDPTLHSINVMSSTSLSSSKLKKMVKKATTSGNLTTSRRSHGSQDSGSHSDVDLPITISEDLPSF